MPRQVFDYDPPDRFVAGTVGEPGSRTFFLQARSGTRVTSVALEKAQVSVLAERVDELLDEVVRVSGGKAPVPAVAPVDAEDNDPLETPIEEEFRVGAMSLAWDPDSGRVVVECYAEGVSVEEDEDEETDELEGAVLRVSISGAAARAFTKRALAVVAAGRPPCPFCTNPLDPSGHICPRANGYRR
ncbi:MAG TPA: DUF3090 domain-containing protein [Kineosporiaceae bacterium]|nr:DUF3090 domain-containing protein [Kineosporiaceae bacterium]